MIVNVFTKEWINLVNKFIDDNGCWIPSDWKAYSDGYIHIRVNNIRYLLHRISMCVYHNISYYDYKVDTRHSKGCDKECFNPEHLNPGTKSDNTNDSVLHGTHRQSQKEVCTRCGGDYTTTITKTGWTRGQKYRFCKACRTIKNANRYK